MAIENFDTAPHEAANDLLSSPTKEGLVSSTEEVGDAGEAGGNMQSGVANEKAPERLDPEGDLAEAEGVGDDLHEPATRGTDSSDTVAASIPNDGVTSVNGEDVNEDEGFKDVNEDDGGSVESFDSALERIAATSAGDPASPMGPSSPLLEATDTDQENALRQINFLSSGVSSLDTTLLENASAGEFKSCVAQIAEAHGISVDSVEVKNILSVLVPLVDEGEDINGGTVLEDGSKNGDRPKDEAESCISTITIEGTKHDVVESNGGYSKPNRSEDLDALPLEAAQGEVNNEVPAKGTEYEKLEVGESLENGPTGGDPDVEIQANQAENRTDLEPEVIEWDELNKSDDDDDHSSVTSQPPEKIGEAKEKDGYAEGVEVMDQNETRGDFLDPAEPQAEGEENEAAMRVPIEVSTEVGHALGDDTEKEKVQQEVVEEQAQLGEVKQEEEAVKLDGDKQEEEATKLDGDDEEEEATKPGEMAERETRIEDKFQELGDGDGDAAPVAKDGLSEEEATRRGEMAEQETRMEDKSQESGGGDAAPITKDGVSEERIFTEVDAENESIEARERTAEKESVPENERIEARERAAEKESVPKNERIEAREITAEEESVGARERNSEVDGDRAERVEETKQESTGAQGVSDKPVAASSLGSAGPSLPARPAGLGRSVPSLEHAPRAIQGNVGASSSSLARQSAVTTEEDSKDTPDGSEVSREKLQMIRVKFLRLAHRLGQSAHNVVVAQVLYRLGLAEQLRGGGTGRAGAFSFERASILAEEQEAAGMDDLEFGCTIMVLGKSGVGKSATINSLFDEVKSGTNAYVPATNKVQEIVGTVHGIKLRVIDTPGVFSSFVDQRRNERIMASVKRFIKKSPPDIVLYFDRLDMQGRDYGDLPLLRTITDTFGSAIWFNAIVVLTHASSAPPDGANGVPVSYEMFVAQRSHVVQQTIRQASGDMRLMNPVSLVENHAACRRNRAGERVLPNGQVWKPQLLLLCLASKILAEANSLLKLQEHSTPVKSFGIRSRVPPLPFLLSSLLQSRAPLKLPNEQMGSDDESEDDSEGDSEGEEEYDDLPPFRRLTKAELNLLDKDKRRIYAEELEYREKLFMKKQLKEERARKKEMKRRLAALPKEAAEYAEESYEDENAPASVSVPMPDMALPPSFDADNPTYRYRYLESANQWLVRPVLETHGWDHDSGYDGLNVEKMFIVSKKVPVSVSGQVTKDKKEANVQTECAASFKNGEGKITHTSLDIQTIGKDFAYTLRSETRFDNFKRNKTTCGLAVTLLGDTVAAGMKIEDRLMIGKRVKVVVNGGALTGRRDIAYGGSLEATIRDKDYPLGQFMSTIGLSVMDWHGDLAIGGNMQVQCKVGKTTVITRGNLNNRRAGQISIRVSSSEQLQMALIGLIPLLRGFINTRVLGSN